MVMQKSPTVNMHNCFMKMTRYFTAHKLHSFSTKVSGRLRCSFTAPPKKSMRSEQYRGKNLRTFASQVKTKYTPIFLASSLKSPVAFVASQISDSVFIASRTISSFRTASTEGPFLDTLILDCIPVLPQFLIHVSTFEPMTAVRASVFLLLSNLMRTWSQSILSVLETCFHTFYRH